jgi:hypothetical protein
VSTEDYDEGYGQCVCGCAWFTIEPEAEVDTVSEVGAAVCIDTEGNVTGYAGKLVCVECETDWDPNVRFKPHGHLRAVE